MTSAATTRAPPTPSQYLAVRACVATAVVAVLAAAWTQAGRSSHLAVQEMQAALHRSTMTLPRVKVASKRHRPRHRWLCGQ
ncbi:MAG: hypothetical protein NVS2B4_07660 [Ramlibacter sp.]